MSAFLDKSDAIQERLEALEELQGVPVLVDNRKDAQSDYDKAMTKVTGASVLIFWQGGRNINSGFDPVRIDTSYIVTVVTKPILRGGEIKYDDIIQAIIKSLNGWNQDLQHCKRRMKFDSVRPVSGAQFSIHAMTFKTNIDL